MGEYLHDVTCIPFPVREADPIFCRFLLTHLHDPQALLLKWASLKKLAAKPCDETEIEWGLRQTALQCI